MALTQIAIAVAIAGVSAGATALTIHLTTPTVSCPSPADAATQRFLQHTPFPTTGKSWR